MQSTQKQLWVIESIGYRLPFHVETIENGVFLVFWCNVHYTQHQKEELTNVIGTIAFKPADSGFYVLADKLRKVAHPWTDQSADPAAVLHWKTFTDKECSIDNPEEFYADFAKWSGIAGLQNPATVKIVFFWFCIHMLDSLVNKQRPVDLHFCTLHPFPYRPDWKQQLVNWDYRMPPSRLTMLGRTLKFCRYIPHIYRRMGKCFFDGLVFSCDSALQIVEWTIDVQMKAPWFDHVRKVELKRRQARGNEYWRGVIDSVKRRLVDAMRLYADWLGHLKKGQVEIPLVWTEECCDVVSNAKPVLRSAEPADRFCSEVDPSLIPDGPPEDLAYEDKHLRRMPTL